MSRVRLRRAESGGFLVEGWPVWAARLLDHLVVLCDPDPVAPEVRERFYPPVGEDEKRRAEWRRSVHPELFALLESARTIVVSDLSAADRGERGTLRRMEIPPEHIPAWISALNTARLHLAALHEIDAGAMRAPPDELTEDKRGPVGLIDFYGWIQGFLVEGRLARIDAAGTGAGGGTAEPPGEAPKKTRKPRRTKPGADGGNAETPGESTDDPPPAGPAT